MIREITINGTTFNVDLIVPSWPAFWGRVVDGLWEPETFHVMDRFLEAGWRWVDIGAWIGPTALYAAAKGALVDAYECDPVAIMALQKNLALNTFFRRPNVYNYALGMADGTIELWSDRMGNSETSVFKRHDGQDSVTVQCRDALKVFNENDYAGEAKTIVKIDVEGSEAMILPRLHDVFGASKCLWLISFHDVDGRAVGKPVLIRAVP